MLELNLFAALDVISFRCSGLGRGNNVVQLQKMKDKSIESKRDG